MQQHLWTCLSRSVRTSSHSKIRLRPEPRPIRTRSDNHWHRRLGLQRCRQKANPFLRMSDKTIFGNKMLCLANFVDLCALGISDPVFIGLDQNYLSSTLWYSCCDLSLGPASLLQSQQGMEQRGPTRRLSHLAPKNLKSGRSFLAPSRTLSSARCWESSHWSDRLSPIGSNSCSETNSLDQELARKTGRWEYSGQGWQHSS